MANIKPSFESESTLVKDHSVVGEAPRRATLPRLEMVRGLGAPRRWELTSEETVIGRSTQANICIESSLLSRKHAAIHKRGPEFRLTDLDSANGVYLNGVRVHSAGLHEGDTIQIGDAVFTFHEGSG
ncbi:MAG TPA: FHA domain-containing protein [Polyangiaceae bacterium]|nr:FHA domain-containing protein [Polyangiaceae bacterium]